MSGHSTGAAAGSLQSSTDLDLDFDPIAQVLETDEPVPDVVPDAVEAMSEDSSSMSEEMSDDEDIKKVRALEAINCSKSYHSCFLFRWHQAVREMSDLLRDNVLLPLGKPAPTANEVFEDVGSGINLPTWHCAFKDCNIQSCSYEASCAQDRSYEYYLWSHLRIFHAAPLDAIVQKWRLFDQSETRLDRQHVLLTLYNAGLAEKERCSVPQLGLSTDRRTMTHVSEVFREDNAMVLMCFSCACKEIAYTGYDKFGNSIQKGNICMRQDPQALKQILCSDADEASRQTWSSNFSAKRFKSLYGKAVATDPGMQDDCFEWVRKVSRNGTVDTMLCCPEDVEMTSKCKHDVSFV